MKKAFVSYIQKKLYILNSIILLNSLVCSLFLLIHPRNYEPKIFLNFFNRQYVQMITV